MEEVLSYSRFVYNHTLFHATEYTRLEKRHNSTALLVDGRIIDIKEIFLVTCHNSDVSKCIVIRTELVKLREKLFKDNYCDSSLYSYIAEVNEELICCEVKNISRKCAYIPKDNGKVYIVPLINDIETD